MSELGVEQVTETAGGTTETGGWACAEITSRWAEIEDVQSETRREGSRLVGANG